MLGEAPMKVSLCHLSGATSYRPPQAHGSTEIQSDKFNPFASLPRIGICESNEGIVNAVWNRQGWVARHGEQERRVAMAGRPPRGSPRGPAEPPRPPPRG